MLMTQVKDIVNTMAKEYLGEEAIQTEDLTNVVDIGKQILGATDIENFTRKLVDHIGKMVFVDRPYTGRVPSILMDGWEYGSILEKISVELPEATENESWMLEDGKSYDPNVFHAPKVEAKFFNSEVTFEVDMSFTERQVKSAFSNGMQLNAFFSMIYNSIEKALTLRIDSLIMRTINNFTAEVLYTEFSGGDYTPGTGIRAVNVLARYNARFGKTLTAEECSTDPDFERYLAYLMGLYETRMRVLSKVFNIGGKDRFTPSDKLHVVMLDEVYRGTSVYLQSDVWHNELTALPKAETVPFWQGSGNDYSFNSTSKISVKNSAGHTVETTGILAVMFDHDAVAVTNIDRRVTTNFNGKAEFTNFFYKYDAGYLNDFNENFVVFYAA